MRWEGGQAAQGAPGRMGSEATAGAARARDARRQGRVAGLHRKAGQNNRLNSRSTTQPAIRHCQTSTSMLHLLFDRRLLPLPFILPT